MPKIKPHYKLKLTEIQKQLIYGGLLGDLCIPKPKNEKRNVHVVISHSSKQAEYVQFKYSILANLVRKPPKLCPNKGWGKQLIRFSTLSHPSFTQIYRICYPDGRKTISSEWLEKIDSPLALATWYMDDGSLSKSAVQFSTHRFSKQENLLLQQWLKNRWKIDSKIAKDSRDRGYFLRLLAKDRDLFFDLIRSQVIPPMQYKILPELKPVPCIICGKPVLPKRAVLSAKKKVVCSDPKCKKLLAKLNKNWQPKQPRACASCGRIFVPTQDKTKTCSSTCRRTWKIQQKRLRRLENKKPLLPRQCLQCDSPFIPRNGHQRICSAKCRKERHRKYWKIPSYPKHCMHCGSVFHPPLARQKYCSVECRERQHYFRKKSKMKLSTT